MPQTYTPIRSTTLTSAAASVVFGAFNGPSFDGYTDLILVTDNIQSGGTQANLFVQFNGDTGTNYSRTWLSGNGTSPFSGRESNQTKIGLTAYAYPQTTTRWIGSIHIMNYANTTTNKTILVRGNNASIGTDAIVGIWRSTSAITDITITRSNDNFAIGSTFTLYGIKAA